MICSLVLLQKNPGNSNSEGKQKTVGESEGLSYQGQLNIQFFKLILINTFV